MNDCIEPGTVSEEALAAYAIDPEEGDAVAQHVAHCPACATEAAEMGTLVSQLSTRLACFDCPTSDAITAYVAGMLPPADRATVERHVQQCSRCTELVADSQEFFAQEPDPILSWGNTPPNPIRAVLRLIPALRDKGTPAPALKGAAPAFALRGEAREMAEFADADNDITISLRYVADVRGGEMLMGNIISGKQPELTLDQSIPIRLLALAGDDDSPASEPIAEAVAEGGNFELAPVSPGRYQIEADLPECRVIVGPVTVG